MSNLTPFLTAALFLLASAICPAQQPATSPDRGKEPPPQLRLVVISCPEYHTPLRIVTTSDGQTWKTHAEFEPRPSFITDWMPVQAGTLHLAEAGTGKPVSLGQMTYPASARRALGLLFQDPKTQRYHIDVIDPLKIGFAKGSTLVLNYTSLTGAVSLGVGFKRLEPAKSLVLKPKPEDNGMYRMLVAYQDNENRPVHCYDRYVPANPDAREILLLLPSPTLGMSVFCLPEFGPFD